MVVVLCFCSREPISRTSRIISFCLPPCFMPGITRSLRSGDSRIATSIMRGWRFRRWRFRRLSILFLGNTRCKITPITPASHLRLNRLCWTRDSVSAEFQSVILQAPYFWQRLVFTLQTRETAWAVQEGQETREAVDVDSAPALRRSADALWGYFVSFCVPSKRIPRWPKRCVDAESNGAGLRPPRCAVAELYFEPFS